jgi:hypothetical protein
MLLLPVSQRAEIDGFCARFFGEEIFPQKFDRSIELAFVQRKNIK